MKTLLAQDILECSIVHPARTMDFKTLFDGLFREVFRGNITVVYHPEFLDLAIFKYSQDCVTERKWNKFSLMARGLILDFVAVKVVATPLVKFFNHGELEEAGCSFLEPGFRTTEKVDGSMGIIFHYRDKWRVATCGSFVSEQAQWAEIWLHENIDVSQMDVTNTYITEIIYPENKIVVTYDFSGLVLLTVFDKFGLEYTKELIKSEASHLHIRKVKEYEFDDVDKILNEARTLDHNHEGFVVRFSSGVRLKIKGDEYVRIHRLISRVTPLAIWDMLLNGDNFEDIKNDLPEELEKDFDSIVSILKKKLEKLVYEVESMWEQTKDLSDKQLGLQLKHFSDAYEGTFPGVMRYIFMRRKNKFYEGLDDHKSIVRRKVFNLFRPTGNLLDGYSPSSVVNRFSEEN